MKPPARADRGRQSGDARRGPLYVVVDGTLSQLRRSGIQRVVVEAGRALAARSPTTFVRYDELGGGLRPFSIAEHRSLWEPGVWPSGVTPDPSAYRLDQTLTGQDAGGWILLPEVPGHGGMSVERFSRVISQGRAAGMRVAAVFYDLIPIEDTRYVAWANQHRAYVAELVRCDLVIAISEHSRERLISRWRDQGVVSMPKVAALLLPEGEHTAPLPARDRSSEVVLVGTVEARKRQIEFLEAFSRARSRSSAVSDLSVRLIGSVHPAVAGPLGAIAAKSNWLRREDYVAESVRTDAVARAIFTVFASENEGYGLPIAESLALGTPCLCADFGAMAEIAAGGGCFTVDVRDPRALEDSIVELVEKPERLGRLRREISRRAFRSWDDYAGQMLSLLERHGPPPPPAERILEVAAAQAVRREEAQAADLIAVSDSGAEAALISRARKENWRFALAPIAADSETRNHFAAAAATIRERHARVSAREGAYHAVVRADPPRRSPTLRIAISTYNRRPFVTANVRWLLDAVLPADGSVALHVVDGASTDGTAQALRSISDPRLTVTALAADPGMQGGLALASRLEGADYVWIVGDDDFILPQQFAAVRSGLAEARGAPVGVLNFSVYRRDVWGEGDTVAGCIRESVPVCEAPAPSGRMPLREAVVQNDNLLTAIYTLVWRADVLAAAYDRPRSSPGFSTMAAAAPCSDFLMRNYAAADVYWHGEPAIIGNAHNSWGARRVEWHGAAMTDAFDLALLADVDREIVQQWADTHAVLWQEAKTLYPRSPPLSPRALDRARRFFRWSVR